VLDAATAAVSLLLLLELAARSRDSTLVLQLLHCAVIAGAS
jgi:hypothetical protein